MKKLLARMVQVLLLVATTAHAATVTVEASGLNNATGASFDANKQVIYFAETGGGRISKFDLGTEAVTTVKTGFVGPAGVAVFGQNLMFPTLTRVLTSTQDSKLWMTGTLIPDPLLEATVGGQLQQVAVDKANGIAYVAGGTGGRIWKIHLSSGTVTPYATGLTGLFGLVMSADFKTAYVTGEGKLVKFNLDTNSSQTLATGLTNGFHMDWANDAQSAIYLVQRGSPARLLRVDLATVPAQVSFVAPLPALAASVVRTSDPNVVYTVGGSFLAKVNLLGAVPGPILTAVGFVPFTSINAAGQATTDPAYFFPVKNASFGGSPHLKLNFPGIRSTGGAYYQVVVDGGVPEKAIWNNYKWNGSTFVLTAVGPDATGYYAVPPAADLWSNPDLGFILDTSKFANGLRTVLVRTYNAFKVQISSQQISLLVDNSGPGMDIAQVSHDGSPIGSCALITSGSPDLDITFSATDGQSHLLSYQLTDRWGDGKSAVIAADQYIGVHDASPTWAGVTGQAESYTLGCTACSHSIVLSGWANTIDGYSYVHYAEDFTHLAVYLPGGSCTP